MTDLLTRKEVAALYGVTPKTISRWVDKVGHSLGQALDKQGTIGYSQGEVSEIAAAGGRKPIIKADESIDAELVEDAGTLTLGSGAGMRLNSSHVGALSININFDLGGASMNESRALTGAADNELMNVSGVLGAALGESVVREAFQRKEIMTANVTNGMVQGTHTALASQGVLSSEAA